MEEIYVFRILPSIYLMSYRLMNRRCKQYDNLCNSAELVILYSFCTVSL